MPRRQPRRFADLDLAQHRRATPRQHGRVEAYDLTIDGKRGIVELRLGAHMSVVQHHAAREALIALCVQAGIRRILVDASEVLDQPVAGDLFHFASGWPAILLRSPVVVAGVLPRSDAVRRWWRFGEDAAVNRGLISHPFETADEARAWLARW